MQLFSTIGDAPTSVSLAAAGYWRTIQEYFSKAKFTKATLRLSQKQDNTTHIIKWELVVCFTDAKQEYTFPDLEKFMLEEPSCNFWSTGIPDDWVVVATISYDRISELEKRIAILEREIKK